MQEQNSATPDAEAQVPLVDWSNRDTTDGNQPSSPYSGTDFNLEDLPEGVVCRSLKSLADSCLSSAVRLGSTSKLLFCYFYSEVANDDTLSTDLLQQQEDYTQAISNRHKTNNKYLKGITNALTLAVQPGSIVFCYAIILLTMAAKKFIGQIQDFDSGNWIPSALIMFYCTSVMLVTFTLVVGWIFKVPDMEVVRVVAWALLLPFVLTIVLFMAAIMVSKSTTGDSTSKFLRVLILPQGLLIGAVASQILSFMAWFWSDSSGLSRRSQGIHFWHLISEVMLTLYLHYYP